VIGALVSSRGGELKGREEQQYCKSSFSWSCRRNVISTAGKVQRSSELRYRVRAPNPAQDKIPYHHVLTFGARLEDRLRFGPLKTSRSDLGTKYEVHNWFPTEMFQKRLHPECAGQMIEDFTTSAFFLNCMQMFCDGWQCGIKQSISRHSFPRRGPIGEHV
jgi:hypothetical protein